MSMVSKGKYVSENSEKEDCLTFWGEWEPQSLVERLPEMGGAFPNSNRFLITKG
jgi:hypothetical protein